MALARLTKSACSLLGRNLLISVNSTRSYVGFRQIKTVQPPKQVRTFFQFFKKRSNAQIKELDNIPDEYILIYKSTLERYLSMSHVVLTVSAIIGGLAIILKYEKSDPVLMNLEEKGRNSRRPVDNEIYAYFTLLALGIVGLQYFIQKSPTRIYYYPRGKDYVFIFNGLIPTKIRKVATTVGHVRPTPNSVVPWKETCYEIKNHQDIILLEQNFRRPADLYVMMGIQKDVDE